MTTDPIHEAPRDDCTMCVAAVPHDHRPGFNLFETCPHSGCAACGDLLTGQVSILLAIFEATHDPPRDIRELDGTG